MAEAGGRRKGPWGPLCFLPQAGSLLQTGLGLSAGESGLACSRSGGPLLTQPEKASACQRAAPRQWTNCTTAAHRTDKWTGRDASDGYTACRKGSWEPSQHRAAELRTCTPPAHQRGMPRTPPLTAAGRVGWSKQGHPSAVQHSQPSEQLRCRTHPQGTCLTYSQVQPRNLLVLPKPRHSRDQPKTPWPSRATAHGVTPRRTPSCPRPFRRSHSTRCTA